MSSRLIDTEPSPHRRYVTIYLKDRLLNTVSLKPDFGYIAAINLRERQLEYRLTAGFSGIFNSVNKEIPAARKHEGRAMAIDVNSEYVATLINRLGSIIPYSHDHRIDNTCDGLIYYKI